MRPHSGIDLDARFRVQFRSTDDFNQGICVAARDIVGNWYVQNARDDFFVGLPDHDFITGFDVVRGFRRAAVEQNNARIAKLLGNCAARAKPAEF